MIQRKLIIKRKVIVVTDDRPAIAKHVDGKRIGRVSAVARSGSSYAPAASRLPARRRSRPRRRSARTRPSPDHERVMIANTGQFEYDSFDAMGTRISFWVDRAAGHRASSAIAAGTKMIRDIDNRLSRFKPDSELCALNADPRETVEVSTLMARFVDAAVEIAQLSDGLIDPTLIEDIEDLGYRDSLAGVTGAPLADALAQSPSRHPRPARSRGALDGGLGRPRRSHRDPATRHPARQRRLRQGPRR